MERETAPAPGPDEERRLSLSERASRQPVAACVVSGLALWAAFPPMEWSWLAWIALTPLFRLAVEPVGGCRLYLAAWAGGVAFWFPSLQWVRLTDPTAWSAWVAMAGIFSLWWPGFLALTRFAMFRLGIPLMIAAPILWVGLEHVRAFILSGFPWYYLGHSQYRVLPLIQIADFAGALGVSFLIATVNAWIVDLLTLPALYRAAAGTRLRPRQAVRLWYVLILILGTLAYGAFRLRTANFTEGPRLALLQTNFEQRYKSGADPAAILARVEALAIKAASREPKPDLIVWPETSYPYNTIEIDPATPAAALGDQLGLITDDIDAAAWRERAGHIDAYLRAMTDSLGSAMLVGTLRYTHTPEGLRKYNAAVLTTPASPDFQIYRKIQLVPFGEYIPLVELFPWLMVFTPYRDGYIPSLTFGCEANTLKLGDHRVAVAICFEDTVPHLIRRFFAEAPDGLHPDVLIDASNDGWFHGSAELDMHLAVSVFRSIENRVPLARAVNTGISAVVDGDGRIREVLPRQTEGVLHAAIPLDPRTAPYTSWGDWLGLSCIAVCVGIVPTGLAYRRLRPALIKPN
ncbi:apolipoprotein N-acyltransferase [Paludisphaera sp.]|uniref:apolipoprotein N-acyltransferase n=1 Tax=Paludisphaera sp. TaxID=2017432 RepID=UPI00301B91C2